MALRGYSCKYAPFVLLADFIIGQLDRKVNYGQRTNKSRFSNP